MKADHGRKDEFDLTMGACLGRDQKETRLAANHDDCNPDPPDNDSTAAASSSPSTVPELENVNQTVPGMVWPESHRAASAEPEVKVEIISRHNIDQLVLKTLAVIRLLVDK